ncbi:MAG: hypothetical protein ACRDNZ_22180 [Streptosporangiaceae bacterium]
MAVLTALLLAGLAGCGSRPGASPASTATPAASVKSQREASSGKAGQNPLARSPLRILTTLSKAQLCATLSSDQAVRILGAPVQAPTYGRQAGLGSYCLWLRRGATGLSPDELYVGISSSIDWTGAQQVDKLLHATSVQVNGHPALTAGPLPAMRWAQVDVALGGPHDPVAEFRAPTMAKALGMARAGTPHILSMG